MHGRNTLYLETFNEYQRESAVTDLGTPDGMTPLVYYALAINGEAGELAEKVKKIYRDKGGNVTDADRDAIVSEGGDMLWYLARLCEEVGVSLDGMARRNVEKLQGRLIRKTLQGSGDDR